MKRFLGFLLLFFMFNLSGQAEQLQAAEVSFIYINGSNNNTKEMKDWFFNGVEKMHPNMKKAFDEDDFVQQNFLYNSKTVINPKPVTFFWGDKSSEEVKVLDEDLQITSLVSTKVAQEVRKLIGHSFHDALWVQREFNMRPILSELHELIKLEYNQGHQVMLFGYSAGSFITYQYLFQRLPGIEPKEMVLSLPLTKKESDFVKSTNIKNTCIEAFLASELVALSSDGRIVLLKTTKPFEDKYMQLDSYTDSVCAIPGSIKGIVNFASPIPLFYSSLLDESLPFTKYNWSMYKYIVENGIFWLTVNFREDPLGYPATKNLTTKEIEQGSGIKLKSHSGFFYDRSDVRSGKTFILAHLAYWGKSKRFAQAVVEAYEQGYLHNYSPVENKK